MTVKIKRRSLRCGGRPKADFGSIFTSVIAPALNAAGSIADESIDNNKTATNGVVNNNTTIPSDPTKTPTMRLGGRKKCWIGAAIGAATSIAGSLFGNGAKKREMRRQKSIQDWQTATQEAVAMSSALNNNQDYQEDYLRQFRTAARLGKTLGAKGIYITDGGDATKIGNNTYLLRGGSHEDVNETGQTGIGINVGGNEVEAEGGEVAQKKNGALRIFSAQPILGGISPAQAVMNGANKDKVFNAQQQFKRRNHLSDDGNKAEHGTAVPYKRIHINEDGTFTDTLTGKNYNTSATNGEDVVITGKANHWKEAGKKDTSSYFDPMGAVNFATAAGAPILNANPSNIVGSIRDSKSASDFLKHYMMQDTGGFVNTKWAKEHPYLSLGINTIGDIGLGIGTNKAVDILRHPMNYGKYGYKLNKLYKKAGLLDRGEYKTAQENYEKLLDYYVGNRPYDEGALDFNYETKAMDNAEHVNPDIFYSYVYPNKEERIAFKRAYRKKATDNVFTESSNHPYPSVSSKDFAGGGRSYPIPTKADAVDALRLAGLHGRSDVRSKVYSKYPSLRKKSRGGAEIEPYYDWARNTSSNLGISFIDPTYDYRAYYNSVTPYERALIRFAPQGTHFTDIGKTPKHPTFSNESKYSNNKTPGGTWNGNVFVPNIWQFGNNGNNRRNKYMNNSGEGYFNGRVNVFPTSRKRHSLGGCSRPVKGMRPKAGTGIFVPYNKRYTSIYDAPDYNSDYNGGNVLGNGEVTVTAKRIKPTFMKPNNDAMNIINHPANETPYIPQRHNRSRTIFSGGDYLGLGIDTLAALSTGLVNYNTAGKYVLPDRAPIIQASKLPTTYNVNPEIEEVKRYRDRLTGQTFNNTSSSVAALNRSGAINLDALSNLSKLWATKENEENKMLTEDAKNQQTVAAQNVQNELARQSEIARIKNEATQAKGDALNVGLSGLSQAWTNFWTAGRTAYEDDQSRRAMIASSKEATPTRLSEMDFDLSPDILASLYRTAKDDRTKRFYLSRLSPKQRQKYGIN